MSADFMARLIGMVVFCVMGIYTGIYVADLTNNLPELGGTLVGLVGIVLGLVVTPYITTRPMRSLRSALMQVSAQTLGSGMVGLIVGLLIATLLAYPLSLLPSPFGPRCG